MNGVALDTTNTYAKKGAPARAAAHLATNDTPRLKLPQLQIDNAKGCAKPGAESLQRWACADNIIYFERHDPILKCHATGDK